MKNKKYWACNCYYGGVYFILYASKYEDNKIVQYIEEHKPRAAAAEEESAQVIQIKTFS